MPPIKRHTTAQKGAPGTSKRARKNEAKEAEALPDSEDDELINSSSDDDSFPENSSEDSEAAEEEEAGADEDDDGDVKEIQVEFEFFDPEEKDFLGLKALLSSYLNGEQFDSSGFIDAIIDEGDVGSVVKTDEDDDPIAVMAVLNTSQYKDSPFMKQIKEWLLAQCPSANKTQLSQALESSGTGLIVNERLLNAPPKLGPPLIQFLMHEIQDRAKQDGPDAKWFRYQRYLLATRVYVDSNAPRQEEAEAGPSKQQIKKNKQQGAPGASSSPSPTLVFVRPEDEYLHQQCAWSFTFPVDGRPVTKDGLVAHRLVMQVDADRVDAARAELDSVVGNMAAGMEAGAGQQGPGHAAAAAAAGGSGAGPSSSRAPDVEQMAAEMFATAAAAGAGRGAGQRAKQKKKKKVSAKAVTL